MVAEDRHSLVRVDDQMKLSLSFSGIGGDMKRISPRRLGGMPTPVKVYTWSPGGGRLAINEFDWSMFDLPARGTRYWHGRDPYVVREVDETTDPVTVHLENAAEWADELRNQLPSGYWLDGGRSDAKGEWHFTLVKDGVERPIGLFYSEALEDAVNEATTAAQEREGRG
jgi:hypothetical protein